MAAISQEASLTNKTTANENDVRLDEQHEQQQRKANGKRAVYVETSLDDLIYSDSGEGIFHLKRLPEHGSLKLAVK